MAAGSGTALAGRVGAKITLPGVDTPGDDEPRSEAFADTSPRDLQLVTPNYTIDLADVAQNLKFSRTISGASTVTILCSDPHLTLLNHPGINPFGSGDLNALLVLDRQVFSLAGLSLQAQRRLQLTLEDDAVAVLRSYKGFKTAKHGYFTRAQFIHSLCAEAAVPFVCPEIDDKQPIAKSKDALSPQDRRKKRASGISKQAAAGLLMKGAPITEEQRTNLVAALDVARTVGASRSVVLAMLVYGIQESNWTYAVNNQNPSNPASGVFQLLASTQRSTGLDPHDVTACAHWFLTKGFGSAGSAMKIAADSPDWSPGQVALYTGGGQNVYQASSYDRWLPDAQAIINAYTGGSTELTDTVTVDKPQQYKRKQSETSWDCMRRLADEVGWYLFVANGTVHFHSPQYLRRSQPQMLVTPGADGIDDVTFEVDASPKFDDTITVNCHMSVWQAAPGSSVDVVGYGPVDGRWIVQSINRDSLASTRTRVVLQPPGKKKKEPAPDTKQKKVKGADVAGPRIDTSGATGSRALALPVDPILQDSWGWHPGVHDGIDLICNPSATLTAICEAQVVRADPGGWWGLGAPSDPAVRARGDGIIILRALVDVGPIKKGMNFCYGHAESPMVTVGQTVQAGDVIGKAGFANAWHVHFMVNAHTDDRGVGDRDPRPFVEYLQKHAKGTAAAAHPRT